MCDHGTTSIFPGWYIRFQQAALAALPRPPELDQDTGFNWADNGGTMKRVFAEVFLPKQQETAPTISVSAPANPIYPARGEVFELTLNGNAPENDPIEMVRRDGHGQPEKWKHTGRRVRSLQTRRFKLVSVGSCHNFAKLAHELARHGTIPEGQWREALKAAYKFDYKGPVGIANSSWANPDGFDYFPCISVGGRSYFHSTSYGFGEDWWWLVKARK